MRGLARFVTGRRTKWLVLVAWIVLVAALSGLGSKLTKVTDDRTQAALPRDAQSTKVIKQLSNRFPRGETASALIVYQRAGGLTAADRAKIARDSRRAAAELPLRGRPSVPFAPGIPPHAQVARGGYLAYTVLAVPNRDRENAKLGKKLRRITGSGSGGLHIYVTGDLGFSADFKKVFGSFDTKLVLATVLLVLVLLLLIYRSPVIALASWFALKMAIGGCSNSACPSGPRKTGATPC